RVLRSGRRFAFSVWDTPDKTVGFGIVLSAIRKHGDMNVPLPPGPPFFRFSDPAESIQLLQQAGLNDIHVTSVPQTWRLQDPEALFNIMMNASVRNAALLRAQSSDVLAAIQKEMTQGVLAYREKNEFALPMPAVLFSARK